MRISNSDPVLPPSHLIVGPATRFRIEGRELRQGEGAEPVIYRDGKWHCAGHTFTILESDSPTLVRFEDKGAWRPTLRGPFLAIHIVGGTVRCGPDFQEILAEFDEAAGSWCVLPEREHYSDVVLAPAPPITMGTTPPEKSSVLLHFAAAP